MTKMIEQFQSKYSEKKWFLFITGLASRYKKNYIPEAGAQMTYYIVLAIFPFLIFFLNILKFTPLADAQVLERLLLILPLETQDILKSLINDIMLKSSVGLLSLGAFGAVWSSSKALRTIIKAVNRAFNLEESRPYWKLRGLSILFTIGLIIALLMAFFVLIFGKVLFDLIVASYNLPILTIWKVLRLLAPLVFITLIFSLLYKFSPSVKEGTRVKFKDTIPGSVFASVGWVLFSMGFSFYINNFKSYATTYGSIGGIIILLVWIYASSNVMLLGAEVNATLISIRKRG